MSFASFWLKLKILGIETFKIISTNEQIEHENKMKMELDILVYGASTIDYITYVNDMPRSGETVFGMHREQCFGGKGANQCVAASKLGARCALISKLGKDKLGEEYLEYLKDLEINVDFVELLEDQVTGMTEINVAENAHSSNIMLPGANQMLKAADVTNARRFFKKAKVLLCQLETDEKAVLYALQNFKGMSILNASPAHKDLSPDLIKAAKIICCNRVEAAVITNREEIVTLQDAKAAAIDLKDMGAKSVIITMGDLGAIYLDSKEPDLCTHCPAGPVRYLADTSGASDAFLGSLAYHMAIYPNLLRESHILAANLCAAYCVGHRGTQPSFPGPELFQERLCQYDPLFYVVPDENPEGEAETSAQANAVQVAEAADEEKPQEQATVEVTKVEPKDEEARCRSKEMSEAGIKTEPDPLSS